MTHPIACWRCGASLGSLSLPLSRQDSCPDCGHHLHVCRQCRHFDPAVVKQCREDDAEEVLDKERQNFCDYFSPGEGPADSAYRDRQAKARQALDALFDDGPAEPSGGDDAASEAEKLFR